MEKLRVKKTLFGERLILIALISTFTVICFAQFGGGQGTAADPWQIGRPDHLHNIRDFLGPEHIDKYYIQTNDIDLGEAPWNEGQGWLPIGSTAALSFQGQYDGRGHTISNLTINRAANFQALFGYTVAANIKNLGLKDVNIWGNHYVAGLIGRQDGTSVVQACYVTGSIAGDNYVAGIVGYMRDAGTFVFDCYNTAAVVSRSLSPTHYIGGICAYQFAGQMRRSYNVGKVESRVFSSNSGALIGNYRQTAYSSIFWNIHTTFATRGIGNVADSPGHTTRFLLMRDTFEEFDFNDMWSISQDVSYPYLRWQGDEPEAHNLRPLLPPQNFRATGGNRSVNLQWDAAPGDFGDAEGYNIYRNGERINDQLIILTQYEDTGLDNWVRFNYYATAVFEGEESISSAAAATITISYAGSGTAEDPWQVSNAEELGGVRYFLGPLHNNKYWIQTADIDLGVAPWNEGEGWDPIGTGWIDDSIQGVYDGQGHIIDGLFINRPARTGVGLFGFSGRGTHADSDIRIRNLGLTNVNVTGGNYVGGIVGWHRGAAIIENCFVTGRVVGGDRVGGIAGLNQNGGTIIRQSYSRADVQGVSRTGGFVGYNSNNSASYFSYSTGRVEGAINSGFTGQVDGASPVEDCYWDIESSNQQESAGGIGRLRRQMVHPYDDETYVNWDFEELWNHDETRAVNDGYPILYYQETVPPLDPPEITVDLIYVEEVLNVRIRWEPVEDALSYRIYSSAEPYTNDWGIPIATVGEDITVFTEPINETGSSYYYVTSSSEPDRGNRGYDPDNRRRLATLRALAPLNENGPFPGDEIIDQDGNITIVIE